jgi:bacillithiol biosynthesis deacetylase BshB1
MPADVLFFGAHPDDVEWGAGGIALLLRDQGFSCAIVDMTNGEMGSRGTSGERKTEAVSSAVLLGAVARENLNLPDGGIVDSPENRRLVASAIRRHRPKIVIAPLWEDRHPDHAAAGLLVQNSRLFCGLKTFEDANPPYRPGAFLFYPIHKFHPPTFVIDTSTVFERKLELLRIYRSQFAETAGDSLLRLESRDRYYGSSIGTHHGEALVADQPIRLHGPGDLLSLLT